MTRLLLYLVLAHVSAVTDAPIPPRCYLPPVAAPVAEPFIPPGCLYCTGHRGIEYSTAAGSPARAVAAGTVSFAGAVAGIRYLTVQQDDGLVATYGMWQSSPLRTGDRVEVGQVIAATTTSFYFGLRDQGVYIDPAQFLGRTTYRPRLVPIDATAPRPAVVKQRCSVGSIAP